MKPFAYICPSDLGDALNAIDRPGSDTIVIAGGTDVMVWLNSRAIHPECVVDLRKLEELKFIREEPGKLRIGARTTFTELIQSDLVQRHAAALGQAARESAGPQVRNLGTIGGNLATASPAGDLVLALMALGAEVELASARTRRTLPLEELLVGPRKTCLEKGELITEVVLPTAGPMSGSGFRKLGNRKAMTISIASAAALVTLSPDGKRFENVRLALGSVAPTVVRAMEFERALLGQPATAEQVRKVRHLLDAAISPITDLRSSAWYRAQIAPVLAVRSVEDALATAQGRAPDKIRAAVKRGRGIANTLYTSTVPAAPNPYSVTMQMREDGSVVVQAGGCDIGQGSNTVIATVAAEALGVSVDQVTVYSADTGSATYDFGTVSSRQTFAGGNAVLLAAEQIRNVLFRTAEKQLQAPAERLVLKPGFIVDSLNPEACLPIAAAAALSLYVFRELPSGSATFYPKNTPPDENMQGQPIASFYYNAAAAEVAVDTETGVVTVEKLYSVVDCGKAINPGLVEGQVEGGAMQALGWALREDSHPGISPPNRPSEFHPDFEPKDLSNYPIATSMDIPDLQAGFVEVPEKDGPYGAKACGEIGAITPTPAILNAIHNAVGIRILELPATPERVLRALQQCPSPSHAEAVCLPAGRNA